MTFEMREGRFVSRIFYAEIASPHGNMMGFLYRDADPNEWHLLFRVRYYVDDLTDDESKDRKKWFSMTTEEPLSVTLPRTRTALTEIMKIAGGSMLEEVIVDSAHVEDLHRHLFAQRWVHVSGVEEVPKP